MCEIDFDDDELSMFLQELEDELTPALRPVAAQLAAIRGALTAFAQRSEIGPPPELPAAIRAYLK